MVQSASKDREHYAIGMKRVLSTEILHDVRSTPAAKPGDATTTYSAEDIRIQQYGDAAVVAFRLVGKTVKDGKTEVANFLNSGTFLRRKGKWQGVNWQATRMPRPEAEQDQKTVAVTVA